MTKLVEDMDMTEYGLYLGFPTCCVDSFVHDVQNGGFWKRAERKLHGTGFVPCATCDENHTEEELVNIINMNRLHPVPFPDWKI